eukprot:TRINITY_DN8192_c0_g2_i1.p1 TRINITY_DN8192_c0_g2~~TRINITY_DN8192_c0_g2_i1.p1  ORF type:complete len:117 (+),score=20.22 TRINITY_DN8192_c0_g2_i1:151-501(+)
MHMHLSMPICPKSSALAAVVAHCLQRNQIHHNDVTVVIQIVLSAVRACAFTLGVPPNPSPFLRNTLLTHIIRPSHQQKRNKHEEEEEEFQAMCPVRKLAGCLSICPTFSIAAKLFL